MSKTAEHFNDKLLSAALAYGRRGWRVHPLRPGTKIPVLPDWVTQATTDAETIATWWSGEYRGFNIGIATGKASDLWVLDVDFGHGPDAAVSLERLEGEHKPLKPTYTVETPSGGRHFYYGWPDEVPADDGALPTWRNTSILGAGIDVRAEGGQVAAWPSVLRDGTKYRRLEQTEPVRLPKWLAGITVYREPEKAAHTFRASELNPVAADVATRYGLRAVEGEIDRLKRLSELAQDDPSRYEGPPWDMTVFSVACRLLELAHADWAPISEADAYSLLLEHAPRDRGFDDARVEQKWRSARRKVGDDEAKLPATIIGPYVLEGPGPRPTKGRDGEAVERPPSSEEFFDKSGLRADAIARWVNRGDLAIGVDGALWAYDGGVWRPNRDVVIQRGAALLKDRWRHSYAATIEDLVRQSPLLYRLRNDVHRDLVNVVNGMLDWQSGELRPHEPAYLSTVQLPVEWDLEAACPRFDRWVGEVVPEGVAVRLWEVVGYMLLPGNDLQKAVLLYGPGGNGKGTLIRVLKHLIGSWNCSSVNLKQMTEGRFEVAGLYGKQANLAGDIEPRYLRETAIFKALTGGDMINAQWKHKDPFDFVCYATPLFSSNELWRSSDNSEGYHRRWVHLPMERTVTALGRFDEADLLAELPGILVQAIRAVRTVMATGAFTESVETRIVSDDFREQSDLVSIWLHNDEAVLKAEPHVEGGDSWMRRDHIYQRFRRWAGDGGHGSMSQTKFYAHLERLGYTPRRDRRGRGFFGLVLNSDEHGYERVVYGDPEVP